MSQTPAFLDSARPDVPNLVVPRGVVPFHLPGRPVRGRLVRLGPLADALLTRHDNHPAVTALAGQALALAAALAGALKFRGSFSLQAKGDGPVPMLLADCTEAGALRGYARANRERGAGAGGVDEARAQEAQDDAWRAATAIAATLTEAELLDEALPSERLLHRLFSTEGAAVDQPRALAYGCRCSRARLTGILEGFSPDDLDHMAADGDIVMTCEFCNFDFRFEREKVQGTAG